MTRSVREAIEHEQRIKLHHIPEKGWAASKGNCEDWEDCCWKPTLAEALGSDVVCRPDEKRAIDRAVSKTVWRECLALVDDKEITTKVQTHEWWPTAPAEGEISFQPYRGWIRGGIHFDEQAPPYVPMRIEIKPAE